MTLQNGSDKVYLSIDPPTTIAAASMGEVEQPDICLKKQKFLMMMEELLQYVLKNFVSFMGTHGQWKKSCFKKLQLVKTKTQSRPFPFEKQPLFI